MVSLRDDYRNKNFCHFAQNLAGRSLITAGVMNHPVAARHPSTGGEFEWAIDFDKPIGAPPLHRRGIQDVLNPIPLLWRGAARRRWGGSVSNRTGWGNLGFKPAIGFQLLDQRFKLLHFGVGFALFYGFVV